MTEYQQCTLERSIAIRHLQFLAALFSKALLMHTFSNMTPPVGPNNLLLSTVHKSSLVVHYSLNECNPQQLRRVSRTSMRISSVSFPLLIVILLPGKLESHSKGIPFLSSFYISQVHNTCGLGHSCTAQPSSTCRIVQATFTLGAFLYA